MFEEFFERPHILERHRSGPFALERHRYLSHLHQIGQGQHRLLVISSIILHAAKCLNISNGEAINLKTLTKAADDWIQQRTLPNTQPRSVRMARTDFVATTAKWLWFLGRLEEAHSPLPFVNQLEGFLKNLREERGLADSTVEHRSRSLTQFFLWLISRSRSIATVDPRDITEYFSVPRSPSWKRATVKSYAECLRTFFRYAESRSWCIPGLATTIDAPHIYSFEPLPKGRRGRMFNASLQASMAITRLK